MANNKGKLHVTSPDEVTYLRVLNTNRQEVVAGVHELQAELDPGIYLVEATVPGDRMERYVAVESHGMSTVDDLHLQFDSYIPLLNVRSAHDIHRISAESHSKKVDVTLGGDSANARLFLFARTKGDARQVCPTFTLYSQSGQVTFPMFGACSLIEGWLALTVDLPAGTHMLEQEVPGLGKRCQVLFVEEGWETQVFAPWEAIPNFARSTIYMRRRGIGFNPSMEYEHVEAVVDGLARGRLILTAKDLHDFLAGKFDNPMLGLIACYALLEQPEINYKRLGYIATNMKRLLPHSPDVQLISLLADLEGGLPFAGWQSNGFEFVNPLLLAKGTEHLMRLAAESVELCPADSLLAEISIRLTTGSAWTRCDSGISRADALERLQKNLQTLRNKSPELSATEHARILKLPLSTVEKAISASDGAALVELARLNQNLGKSQQALSLYEQALVTSQRVNDPAFAEFYKKYERDMYSFILHLTGRNIQDAEVIMIETFVGASLEWYKRRDLEEKPRRSWLYKIASNKVKDHYRRLNARNKLLTRLAEEHQNQERLKDSPENERVWLRLDKLPKQDRLSLLLVSQGFSIREIAEVLNVEESDVHGYLGRGGQKYIEAAMAM